MDARAIDEAWSRGEGRCSICYGLPPEEWESICDCSQFLWESCGLQTFYVAVGENGPVEVEVFPPHRAGGGQVSDPSPEADLSA